MTKLRSIYWLRLFVLAWFSMTLAVATASPWARNQSKELVCAGSGGVKLVVVNDQGTNDLGHSSLDCPLCLLSDTPPTHFCPLPTAAPRAADRLSLLLLPCPAVTATAAPPPVRGPPLFPSQS